MDRAQHALLEQIEAPESASRLTVRFARDEGEVREAQQLRWRVFSEELGANLPSGEHGIDRDIFDRHCRHLLVRDERAGRVVGTYRVLAPDAARRIGCYYSEEAFDLTRLRTIRSSLVEVGRSCIDPGYRRGAVIAMLWAGLARYMIAQRCAYLAGSASMSLAKGGVAAVYDELSLRNMAPVEFLCIRVTACRRATPAWSVRASRRRRSSRPTCAPGRGCAANPRGTRTSIPPTSSCCCRSRASIRATQGTSSGTRAPSEARRAQAVGVESVNSSSSCAERRRARRGFRSS